MIPSSTFPLFQSARDNALHFICLLYTSLRWVASKPNVKVVLSGMSTMEQVEDNLHTFGKFEPLTEKETNLDVYKRQLYLYIFLPNLYILMEEVYEWKGCRFSPF